MMPPMSTPEPAPLPEPLEARAFDVLLDDDAAARDLRWRELLQQAPAHGEALRRLRERLRRGDSALCDAGLAEPPPPREVGPYRLLQQLGEGGFGVVWLGEQTAPIRRRVAVKLLRAGMDSANVLRRFEAERQVLARFDHPSINKVLDAGATAGGEPYLVTEYVPGVPLTTWCEQHASPLAERLALLLQVCDGVQHAHQRGVIHRDLKPSNVLVASVDGAPRAKIIDFGLARAFGDGAIDGQTRAGVLLGTPEYTSPEQAEGSADVDTRTDIHALGTMLFELITGDLPFGRARWRRAGMTELVDLIRRQDAPPPSACVRDPALARVVRGELDWIVQAALQKDRERRYADVAQFAADLRAFLAHRPVSVGAPGAAHRLRRFVQRHRLPVALAATALAALFGGLAISLVLLARTHRAEAAATETLQRFFGLADVVHLQELRREADAAWPATPDRAAAYAAWLRRAEALLARAGEHQRIVQGTGAGGEADRFLRETLQELTAALGAFAGADGEVASVRQRLAFAGEVQRRTIDDAAAPWQRAAAAVAADPRHHGLDLRPQLGLVPLGADPESGLEEFALLQTGRPPPRDADGRLRVDADSALVLVLLPGGRCTIGAQDHDPAAPRYEVQPPQIALGGLQEVELVPFFCAKHELTRGQWQRVFGRDPSHYPIGAMTADGPLSALHPVENLDWAAAHLALQRLGLSLPTEAQWEYAARGGTTTRWWTGDDPTSLQGAANLGGREAVWMPPQGMATSPELDDGVQFMAEIGRFRANAFGLHDVVGNYSEWCLDAPLRLDVPVRPGDGLRGEVPPAEREHLLRGGSYADPALRATASYRAVAFGRNTNSLAGLRAVRRLDP
jgi:formylglycine-generating enzyme required for sulfatase activity/tRNA A-37 threonylcarbamoyl transferase component Bud32